MPPPPPPVLVSSLVEPLHFDRFQLVQIWVRVSSPVQAPAQYPTVCLGRIFFFNFCKKVYTFTLRLLFKVPTYPASLSPENEIIQINIFFTQKCEDYKKKFHNASCCLFYGFQQHFLLLWNNRSPKKRCFNLKNESGKIEVL